MKVISLVAGTTNIRLAKRDEPRIAAPDDVKVRMVRVGICSTDREESNGARCRPPEGIKELVIGHEMLGQVVEVGSAVTWVKPGDNAVFTVRRGCGQCLLCAMNRSDMCHTGRHCERGIWGLHGYQAEFVVDKEQYVVSVPSELEAVGVLTEPLAVAEKAIDEAVRLQMTRLPDASATPNWLIWPALSCRGNWPDWFAIRAGIAIARRRGIQTRRRGCGHRPPTMAHHNRRSLLECPSTTTRENCQHAWLNGSRSI